MQDKAPPLAVKLLSANQEKAIAALLSEGTTRDAAKKSKINESTLWRWLQQPDFQKQYREAQRRVVDGAIAKLQGATDKAVDALIKNLSCGSAFAENAAAQAILTHAFKAIELQELMERIERLEALAGGLKK